MHKEINIANNFIMHSEDPPTLPVGKNREQVYILRSFEHAPSKFHHTVFTNSKLLYHDSYPILTKLLTLTDMLLSRLKTS